MHIEVIITINTLILKPKLKDENILGIIKKIIKGLAIPPVKYKRNVSCNISMIKNINADLSESWVFL
jgi:hypothetical protein